jgi:hypothetical protein
MRFRWQHRADVEKVRREATEWHRDQVRARWPEVHAAVEPLRRERRLNGWTDTIVSIFGNPPRKDRT